MRVSTTVRIIGVGSALLDVLARVPESFLDNVGGAKGGMELVDAAGMAALLASLPAETERIPGGSAANTIVGICRLGMPGRLLSQVGRDESGSLYVSHIRQAGVEDRAFKFDPSEATGTCVSLVTPDSQRTLRTYLGASSTISPEQVVSADFGDCSCAHIEGYILHNEPYAVRVFDAAREAGCMISLDLASPEVVRQTASLKEWIAEYVDIVLANEDEAAAYADTEHEMDALNILAENCAIAVVKLGPGGALIKHNGESVAVQARQVEAVDTTGAGDLWAAGFLYGLHRGWPAQRAGALGAALGAEVVQVMGASLPETTWERMRRLATAMQHDGNA